jgi:restriction system protein
MGQAIGRAGDGCIDGMIKEDTLGLDIVYVQAKRYADGNTVGRADVQSFAGSLDGVGATKGIFFTTSTFSQGARDYVGRISKRIVLIDGAELFALMVRNAVGVRTRTVYEIKRVDEDYFSE